MAEGFIVMSILLSCKEDIGDREEPVVWDLAQEDSCINKIATRMAKSQA